MRRLEELNDPRKTTGDVLGAGGFARDLGQDVSRVELVAIGHHKVSAARHQVALVAMRRLDDDGRLPLLVGRVGDDEPGEACDLVDLVVQSNALLQVLELHRAGNLGKDGEGVRIPLAETIAESDGCAVLDLQLGAVDDGVTLFLAALLVDDGDGAVAVHGNQVAGLGAYGDEVDEANCTGVLRLDVRGIGDSRCGTADVEGYAW